MASPGKRRHGEGLGDSVEPFLSVAVGQQVDKDRIHSHDAEEEGPFLEAFHIDQPVRKGQGQQAEAPADNHKRGGANPFDDGVDGIQGETRDDTDDAGDDQHLNLLPGIAGALQNCAGQHAPNGVCGGGHRVEGYPVPLGKLGHDVQIHPGAEVMVRHEGLVEARNRPRSVQHLGEDQQPERESNLHSAGFAHHQECHEVGKGELRQHVPKLKGEVARFNAIERPAKKQKQPGALQDVAKARAPAISARPPLAEGKRHGHSHDKHKKGLDEVPEVEAVPRMVIEFHANKAENSAMQGRAPKQLIKPGRFPDQQKHRQAAENIERRQTTLDVRRWCRCQGLPNGRLRLSFGLQLHKITSPWLNSSTKLRPRIFHNLVLST